MNEGKSYDAIKKSAKKECSTLRPHNFKFICAIAFNNRFAESSIVVVADACGGLEKCSRQVARKIKPVVLRRVSLYTVQVLNEYKVFKTDTRVRALRWCYTLCMQFDVRCIRERENLTN